MDRTRQLVAVIVFAVAMETLAGDASAAGRFEGVKAFVSVAGKDVAAPSAELMQLGASVLHQYESFTLVSIPEPSLIQFRFGAEERGYAIEVQEDLDTLYLPGDTLKAEGFRTGLESETEHSDTEYGLYLVQFVGPLVPQWVTALEKAGARLITAIPRNGYLIAAKDAAPVAAAVGVQWVGPFIAAHKHSVETFPGRRQLDIEIADVDGSDAVIAELADKSSAALSVRRYGNEVVATVEVDPITAAGALQHPLIIGVHGRTTSTPSDERQALSVSSLVGDVDPGPAVVIGPTSPGGYAGWLANTNSCVIGPCTNLNANGYRVGIADTGLDGGQGGTAHADLSGRMSFGAHFAEVSDGCGNTCDAHGHGTLIAGIIGGNAATGARDADNFFMGTGIAPSTGIFSTKIFSRAGAYSLGTIFDWAHDARSNGVYIQNHSHNQYPSGRDPGNYNGKYTLMSRQYDFAVRDSNGYKWDGLTPITLTVSAGNIDQAALDFREWTLPPATAKNVIAVGGLENYRPTVAACRNSLGRDFRNLMWNSKRGTETAGRYKPDVVAPASVVVSTKSTVAAILGWCAWDFENDTRYIMDTGTSFAAPVAAGAAVIASSTVYGGPGGQSPALLKAMLIAGAQNTTGGRDHYNNDAILGTTPNTSTGFGRISLDPLLNQIGSYVDQTDTFTSSGLTLISKNYYPYDTAKSVVVALTWTDAPAPAGSTFPLVNNLDLTVTTYASNGACLARYVGNVVDSQGNSVGYSCSGSLTYDGTNNVERVTIPPGSYSYLVLRVRAASINGVAKPNPNGSDVNNQDFAYYILNGQ